MKEFYDSRLTISDQGQSKYEIKNRYGGDTYAEYQGSPAANRNAVYVGAMNYCKGILVSGPDGFQAAHLPYTVAYLDYFADENPGFFANGGKAAVLTSWDVSMGRDFAQGNTGAYISAFINRFPNIQVMGSVIHPGVAMCTFGINQTLGIFVAGHSEVVKNGTPLFFASPLPYSRNLYMSPVERALKEINSQLDLINQLM